MGFYRYNQPHDKNYNTSLMGNKPQQTNRQSVNRESLFCEKNEKQHKEGHMKIEKNVQSNNDHHKSDMSNEQVLYLQNSNKSNRDSLNINFEDLKYSIQEGTTIFSASQGTKYLVQCTKFYKQEQYIKYTDTLIYRLQALRSCTKVKKQLNKIMGIYGQKIFTCSTCSPCTTYKVLVIQKYFPLTLEERFQDPSNLSYHAIYNLLFSFSKVMSAYQYKRLRFGPIDFSKIFVVDAGQFQYYQQFSSQNKQNGQKFLSTRTNQNYQQKQPQNLICKIGDPYIRCYLQQQLLQKQNKTKTLTDVYKNDVLKIGHILQEVLAHKQMHRLLNQETLPREEMRLKQFMQKLVKNYMICDISNRFNWLQIQRYFQQLNTNQKSTRPVSMLQSINTQVHNSYQDSENRAKSTEKPAGRAPPVIYRVPDPLRSYSGRKQVLQSISLNKENGMDTSNYITLKPYKKSESKPNIIIQPLLQPPQVPVQLGTKTYIPQQVTTMNTVTHNSYIGAPPVSNIPQTVNQDKIIFLQNSQNSGYGVVQNTHPEYQIGLKIKYDNLYNIGKFWSKFEGNFVDGSKEGPGTIYMTTGHIFTGYFQKDLAHGKGSVYINGQLVLKGTWKNNILVTQF